MLQSILNAYWCIIYDRYLKYTLDKYVESDYTIVYFHYSNDDENRPSFSWLKEAYNALDRK